MDIQCFIEVLAKYLITEQREAILQEFSEADDGGHCAVCGEKDVPVDERGNPVQGDDDVYEWQERHKENCPVLLLTKV